MEKDIKECGLKLPFIEELELQGASSNKDGIISKKGSSIISNQYNTHKSNNKHINKHAKSKIEAMSELKKIKKQVQRKRCSLG